MSEEKKYLTQMLAIVFDILSRDPAAAAVVVSFLIFVLALLSSVAYTAVAILHWYQSLFIFFSVVALLHVWKHHLSATARKAKVCDNKLKDIPGKYYSLLSKEIGPLTMSLNTPSVYSIFEPIENTTDREKTLEWIRRRVRVIVEKNPFLLGRLRTDPSTSMPSLWIPDSSDPKSQTFIDASFQKFFTEITVDDDIEGFKRDNLPYDKNIITRPGVASLDEADELLAKITILKSSKTQKFAIIFGICHAIADGHSGSQLFSFLDASKFPNDTDVFSLIVERDVDFGRKVTHLLHPGKQHLKKFAFMMKDICFGIFIYLYRFWVKKPERSSRRTPYKWFKLRKDWINQEKKKYQLIADDAAKKYYNDKTNNNDLQMPQLTRQEEKDLIDLNISSFVILAKFIFEKLHGRLHAAVFSCSYEFRSRFRDYTNLSLPPTPLNENLLGNYLELLVLTNEEIADPLKIRRLVNSKGRSALADTKAYDAQDILPKRNDARIFSRLVPTLASWTTYYLPLKFSGFETSLNVPLLHALDPEAGILEPQVTIFVWNEKGDLALFDGIVRNESNPVNANEAPLDGELIF